MHKYSFGLLLFSFHYDLTWEENLAAAEKRGGVVCLRPIFPPQGANISNISLSTSNLFASNIFSPGCKGGNSLGLPR